MFASFGSTLKYPIRIIFSQVAFRLSNALLKRSTWEEILLLWGLQVQLKSYFFFFKFISKNNSSIFVSEIMKISTLLSTTSFRDSNLSNYQSPPKKSTGNTWTQSLVTNFLSFNPRQYQSNHHKYNFLITTSRISHHWLQPQIINP